MSDIEFQERRDPTGVDRHAVRAPAPGVRNPDKSRVRGFSFLIALATITIAGLLAWATRDAYRDPPWTRHGTVRAYVVTMAPEVGGRIVELLVAENQFVHKGDLLMVIDPTDDKIAVNLAEAAVAQAKADVQDKQAVSARRQQLAPLSMSDEQHIDASAALMPQADLQQAQAALEQTQARLEQARVHLERAYIRSPVNGYVTSLLARLGDYADVGQIKISLVDADSFWVDGYFEESPFHAIKVGDPANIKLMGYSHVVLGHVDSVARGVQVANAQPDRSGWASTNSNFTSVRLAQRVPVRVHIDHVPNGMQLFQGMTAAVEMQRRGADEEASLRP